MQEENTYPVRALNKRITELDRIELCKLAIKICDYISEKAVDRYCGGIFPTNISFDRNGNVSIGEGKDSAWEGEELNYIAPELYWDGRRNPASDVYSLGLVLYYAVSGGKLPFEDETKQPEQKRMSGEPFAAPEAAGERLGPVITKATAFNINGRYQTLEEMKEALCSCISNPVLDGSIDASAVFGKSEDQLSETERMMADIICGKVIVSENDGHSESPSDDEEVKIYGPTVNKSDVTLARQKIEIKQDSLQTAIKNTNNAAAVSTVIAGEPVKHDTRVGRDISSKNSKTAHYLDADDFYQSGSSPAIQYTKNIERERKLKAEIKRRRRRPVAVIALLCLLLIASAAGFNAVTGKNQKSTSSVADITEQAESKEMAEPITLEEGNVNNLDFIPEDIEDEESLPADQDIEEGPADEITDDLAEDREPRQSAYSLYVENISWTEAEKRCEAAGGHLVVINDAEELQRIIDLARDNNVDRIWIGCRRVDGVLKWVNNDEVNFYQWGSGEPSAYDANDRVSEDYVMLWFLNGWYYNDNRNDPAADYPDMYSGRLAYVCEYD